MTQPSLDDDEFDTAMGVLGMSELLRCVREWAYTIQHRRSLTSAVVRLSDAIRVYNRALGEGDVASNAGPVPEGCLSLVDEIGLEMASRAELAVDDAARIVVMCDRVLALLNARKEYPPVSRALAARGEADLTRAVLDLEDGAQRQYWLRLEIAQLYWNSGRLDDAIDEYVRALHAASSAGHAGLRALYALGTCYEERGEADIALRYYRQVQDLSADFSGDHGQVADCVARTERTNGDDQ